MAIFTITNFEIPTKVDIKNQKGTMVRYKVRWIDRFNCDLQIGETDYTEKLITIRTGLDKTTAFWTFFHELEHAISEELGLRMTEKQVNGLELGLAQVVADNKWD